MSMLMPSAGHWLFEHFWKVAWAILGIALPLYAIEGADADLWAAGAYTLQDLLSDYLAFVPLMMFSEAWITGMLIAIFVGYRPGWLITFDDSRYLHGK